MKRKICFSFLIFITFTQSLKAQNQSDYERYSFKGDTLFSDGKYLSATKEYKNALIQLTDNQYIEKIETFYRIGHSFQRATDLDSASFYYLKGDSYYHEDLPKILKSKFHHNKASINYALGKTDSAMYHSIKALDIANKTDNLSYQSLTHSNLGDIFLKKEIFEKAEEYYNTSLKLAEKSKDELAKADVIQRIGQLKLKEKNYQEAINYMNKALSIYERNKNKLGILASKTYLSQAYYFSGNFELATQISFQLIPLMNEIEFSGNTKKLINNANEMIKLPSRDSLSKKALAKAKKLMEENIALTTVPEVNIDQKKAIIKFFEEEVKQIKDTSFITYKQPSLNKKLNEISKQKDSLYQAALKGQFKELEIKYRTQEKEKELAEQKIATQEQELLAQQESSKKWLFISLFLISSLLILSVIIYFYFRNKKQKITHQINILKAKQQEQDNLGRELHDRSSKDLEAVVIALNKSGNKQLADQVDIIKSEIRTLSHELSYVDFTESEFDEQIITLAACYDSHETSIELIGLNKIPWQQIESTLKHHLLLTIREAISNVYNHANATELIIEFQKNRDAIHLIISDNGNGFDLKEKLGQGLRNLRNRLKDIGGHLDIISSEEKGTILNIIVKP
ncbi:signal transduction histidine kinase [Nonlabens dokdonensis]|jgi:signal transduction histidine kinase|uniref:Two-component sensor histidine kinase n=2 Tax=Nonlabens dokdonensis TaxID=328515 RepID=L7W3T4_NONDD|nr:tetratricopeptide repeat-containing sensor histidine kinase [Nonlabens dokdonensis]AGC76235.1 two-component sensor histidine kinase [Nonlabens dokdonensis DSW-6]PZX43899.1 signal transduction histidine kinase [Nonlabens dokdonensis]